MVSLAESSGAYGEKLREKYAKYQCSICLHDLAWDPVLVDPCNHVFCRKCLREWRRQRTATAHANEEREPDPVCPNCYGPMERHGMQSLESAESQLRRYSHAYTLSVSMTELATAPVRCENNCGWIGTYGVYD